MKKEEFLISLREELEFDTVLTQERIIKEIEEWDSMSVMILIAFVSDNFNVTLTGEEIKKMTTFQSLIEKIGLEKFN